MASKFLFLSLLALGGIQLSAGGAPPVIHFINALSRGQGTVSLRVKAGRFPRGSAELSPDQDYQIQTVGLNDVYHTSAVYGLKFASFHAYEPDRDKGQAAIYWKADISGFSISYDNTNYKQVESWESE